MAGEAEKLSGGVLKMSTTKYWKNMNKCLIADKEKTPLQCRIGETCFTSIDIIGGKIYSNHPKNMNHVHKYRKGLVSVIITMGKTLSGEEIVFYDGVRHTEMRKRDHFLEHLHVRIIDGIFKKCFHKDSYWRENREVVFLFCTKQSLCI